MVNIIFELIWYFFIYSFIGWCAEIAYAAVKHKKFMNRGFLNGPLCPVSVSYTHLTLPTIA